MSEKELAITKALQVAESDAEKLKGLHTTLMPLQHAITLAEKSAVPVRWWVGVGLSIYAANVLLSVWHFFIYINDETYLPMMGIEANSPDASFIIFLMICLALCILGLAFYVGNWPLRNLLQHFDGVPARKAAKAQAIADARCALADAILAIESREEAGWLPRFVSYLDARGLRAQSLELAQFTDRFRITADTASEYISLSFVVLDVVQMHVRDLRLQLALLRTELYGTPPVLDTATVDVQNAQPA